MSLNDIPSSERIKIGFFGMTNAGKSSLINALTNQNISIVSDIAGTTTDPVSKSMELLPLGAVTLIDTAGYNDKSELGILRKDKTLKILSNINIAILVSNALDGLSSYDKKMVELFEKNDINYIIAYNKCDLIENPEIKKDNEIYVSALNQININELKEKIGSFSSLISSKNVLIDDLINPNDVIILVTPIDLSAPKNRIILPQQQVLRNLLDNNAIGIVTQETQLEKVIKICKNPKLVITDSQVFSYVNSILPKNIKLTSFSIIFARYKGILTSAVKGVNYIEKLKNNDIILISEGCTHHRQCEDIGTVKLPKWLKEYTNKDLIFEFASGADFPEDLKKYSLIIQCGSCMLNKKEVLNRFQKAKEQNIPITNYGITIAYINRILNRSIEIFKQQLKIGT